MLYIVVVHRGQSVAEFHVLKLHNLKHNYHDTIVLDFVSKAVAFNTSIILEYLPVFSLIFSTWTLDVQEFVERFLSGVLIAN